MARETAEDETEESSARFRVETNHGQTVICEADTRRELARKVEEVHGSYVLYHTEPKESYHSHHDTLEEAKSKMASSSYDMFPHSRWWEIRKDGEVVWPDEDAKFEAPAAQGSLGDFR